MLGILLRNDRVLKAGAAGPLTGAVLTFALSISFIRPPTPNIVKALRAVYNTSLNFILTYGGFKLCAHRELKSNCLNVLNMMSGMV